MLQLHRITIKRSLVMAASLITTSALMVGCQSTPKSPQSKYLDMSPNELAEHLIFDKQGFRVNTKVQEGGTLGQRLQQDEIQKICSDIKGNAPDEATAAKVRKLAMESMVYPAGGASMGDWKQGAKYALNAFGYRVGHKTDDHSKKTTGGMCINCHVLDSEGSLPGGSLGPTLEEFGNNRGRGEAIVKYTYEMIYNPHAHFPCTNMPRIGANGVLSKEQINDVVGFLLAADSPVNTR